VRGARGGRLGRGRQTAGGSVARAGQARPAGSSTNTGISREVFSWYSA
jgi:hypothetical protein